MTTSITANTGTYDEFSGPDLDASRWSFLQFPLPDGGAYVCNEPTARTHIAAGALQIDIERFEKRHPVQIMDNCKYVLVSNADFPLPAAGKIVFEADIAARNIDAQPRDYRDGFVSFVLVDMATGFVFDLCVTSDTVFAIDERLPLPGIDDPFTRIVESPLAGVAIAPGQEIHARITIDTSSRHVTWEANGIVIFAAAVPALPSSLKIGLGIFTLHPTSADDSRSLRGQGISALWRNIRISSPAD